MAVQSSFLGSVKISGVEAKAFTRRVMHGKSNSAAIATAKNGKSLVASFSKSQSVTFKVSPSKTAKNR